MNSFGTLFRITLWGESHGPQVGVTLDGVPAGLPLDIPDFEADLARRRSGAKGTTPRQENDLPQIVSGLYKGHTTGAPLTLVFENANTCLLYTSSFVPARITTARGRSATTSHWNRANICAVTCPLIPRAAKPFASKNEG